jgi:hypothetical protein
VDSGTANGHESQTEESKQQRVEMRKQRSEGIEQRGERRNGRRD